MTILGIVGSLRRESHNATLLQAAAELIPPAIGFKSFEGLRAVPPYDEDCDTDAPPHGVGDLRGAIAAADAVLFATPEYNASVPGVLKNALDWASRPFPANALRGKPVAVIGASPSMFGAVWAQAELRKVLGATGARVIDADLPVAAAHEAFDRDGRLLKRAHRDRLSEIVHRLVAEAGGKAGSPSAMDPLLEREHDLSLDPAALEPLVGLGGMSEREARGDLNREPVLVGEGCERFESGRVRLHEEV
jgi:chromate reductase